MTQERFGKTLSCIRDQKPRLATRKRNRAPAIWLPEGPKLQTDALDAASVHMRTTTSLWLECDAAAADFRCNCFSSFSFGERGTHSAVGSNSNVKKQNVATSASVAKGVSSTDDTRTSAKSTHSASSRTWKYMVLLDIKTLQSRSSSCTPATPRHAREDKRRKTRHEIKRRDQRKAIDATDS